MSVVDIAAPETEEVEEKRGRKKLVAVVLLVIAVAAAAGWWFVLKPAAPSRPQPGAVLKLDAIQVNLADGHYLRIGIALQASKGAPTDLDGSKALDATIELFSGQPMGKLAVRSYRDRLKGELVHRLDALYDGEVIGVYFTDFVTQ
ncbi:MAG TPA: flagellar basal body-associated FliL family protein [Nocardioidaceae bacterium]|jgi:flagellar FliL protein|nr:flagellar basal body-associated FliL family protein [Nocardioidaceae bacterium]